jgi:hypothetical protein
VRRAAPRRPGGRPRGWSARIRDDGHGGAGGVPRESIAAAQQPARQEHRAEQPIADHCDELCGQFARQVPSRQRNGEEHPAGSQRRREHHQRVLQRHVVQCRDRDDRCRGCGAPPPRSSPPSGRRRRPARTARRAGPRTLRRRSRRPAPAGSAAAAAGAGPAGSRRCDPTRARADTRTRSGRLRAHVCPAVDVDVTARTNAAHSRSTDVKSAISCTTPYFGVDPDTVAGYAQHAEARGFEALYVPEHTASRPCRCTSGPARCSRSVGGTTAPTTTTSTGS